VILIIILNSAPMANVQRTTQSASSTVPKESTSVTMARAKLILACAKYVSYLPLLPFKVLAKFVENEENEKTIPPLTLA
jgi:hypothetical protein